MEQNAEPMDVDISFTTDDNTKDMSQDDDGIEASNIETPIIPEARYENRGGTFTTGIDIFSNEEQIKMEERAKRFGLQDKVKTKSEKGEDLYSSLGIAEENENRKNLRLNVLHMRGTEDMSTQDVFKYFEDYGPASIEWINDVSCNIVWHDNISAARALLRKSKIIVGLGEKVAADKHFKSEASSFDEENKIANDDCVIEVVGDDEAATDGDDENAINLTDIDCPLPPGLWRKGIDYPKSKAILLRFATRADKKQPNAEKMSGYYKKYGNPNFGGIKGLVTESRKRLYKQLRQSKKRIDNESSDDETERKRSKNPWGTLSETWGQNDSVEDNFLRPELTKEQKSSVKERLGLKTQTKEAPRASSPIELIGVSNSDSSSESNDEEWCKKSKVLRMRMHADDEEEKMLKKRIKQRTQEMYASMQSDSNDLRLRLGSTKKKSIYYDAIQVFITNASGKFKLPRPRTRKVPESEILELVGVDEPEEGEWEEEVEKVEEPLEEEEEEPVIAELEEGEESEDSDISAKEIQGPKGSVIKVVPRVKPRVASTVWARLNDTKSSAEGKDRSSSKGGPRGGLTGDLRSRLGYHNRGRSPLRIEVKNDKYAEESSGTE